MMKILIADDHQLFLDVFQHLLTEQGYEVVATALDGNEAVMKALEFKPDIIFMDIVMPECNGLEATRLIKAILPESKIVILTSSEDDETLFEAIKNGASGYLLKSLHAKELFSLLASLEQGEVILSPGLAVRIFREFSRLSTSDSADLGHVTKSTEILSDRQVEILRLVAQGKMYKEVATDLGLSERTIKYHMGKILETLHVRTKAQAITYAAFKGFFGD
jgi:two-component system NarL family response regulator